MSAARTQGLPTATLRSAALVQQFDFASPDSLAFAIADINGLAVPLTIAPRRANGWHVADKLAGFRVLVAGRVAPIFSVESSANTGGTLRIGVHVPAETPLGVNTVPLEITRDDASGAAQTIAQGMLWVLKASPNLFVVDGYRAAPLLSFDSANWLAGSVRADRPGQIYSIAGTPNIYSASQETRVVIFGTGFRNATDSDPTNNPAGYRNVAESFEVLATFGRYINNNFVGFAQINLPVEYVGPVAGGGMPGIDQIMFRLLPELKQCVIEDSILGAYGEVDISLRSLEDNESSEVNGDPHPRTRILVK